MRRARALVYRGSAHACPACGGVFRRFRPAGRPRRPNAKCPGCGSRERDRFAALLLRRHAGLRARPERAAGATRPPPGRTRVLHLAPESAVADVLRSWPGVEYLSADLRPGRAMVTMDVTRIDRPDGSFDAIWCSHVLEHVVDDRAAMAELRRVLAPNGWAVVGVPITPGATFEDPSATSPAERARLFGQHDHVRAYGMDVVGRLEEAGFSVDVVRPGDIASVEERRRHLLPAEDQPLFLCRAGPHGR